MVDQGTALSVAIIAQDEEKNIPDCLRSVAFAPDIVVVDSGSRDRTLEIAREAGCRVFHQPWKTEAEQRNTAVGRCLHDWVLMIDADERIPPGTRDEILRRLSEPGAFTAFSFPRKNFLHGKWIRHCDWWPDRVIRLMNRRYGNYQGDLHSRWVASGRVGRIPTPIEHYSYRDYRHMLDVANSRSTIMALDLYRKNAKISVVTPFAHGLGMFLKIYLYKTGFLAGFDGLVIAVARAAGTFFKYAKLLELQRHAAPRKTP